MPLTSTHKSFNQFQDSFEVNMTFSCITRQANFNLGNKCNSFSYSIKTWPEPNYNDTAADTISMITIQQQQKRCFEGSFAFGLMLGLPSAAASNNRQVFVRLTYDFSGFERWGKARRSHAQICQFFSNTISCLIKCFVAVYIMLHFLDQIFFAASLPTGAAVTSYSNFLKIGGPL